MTVFMSWSGEIGRQLAKILKRWLGAILPEIRFLTNANNVEIGGDWRSELRTMIHDADCGVFCLTRENLDSPWLYYEAGMLVLKNPPAEIFPFLFGVGRGELEGPFAQFQSVTSDAPSALIQALWKIANEKGVEVPAMDVVRKRTNLMLPAFQSDLNDLWAEVQKKNEGRLSIQEETITEINKKLDTILSILPTMQSATGPASGLPQSVYTHPHPESL